MTKKAMLVIRVEPALKRKLEELARSDDRTLSSLSAKILGDAVEKGTWYSAPALLARARKARRSR